MSTKSNEDAGIFIFTNFGGMSFLNANAPERNDSRLRGSDLELMPTAA